MAAAFAAGAEGIQMGTRFVSCKESPVHENFKNYIISESLNGQQSYFVNSQNNKRFIK